MAEEESEEDKRLRNRLEEKEKEARGLLEKGEIEKAIKAMEELKEGYEQAPEHFRYDSFLLTFPGAEDWLLDVLIRGISESKIGIYEVSKYIDRLGGVLADLYRTAEERGISRSHQRDSQLPLPKPEEIGEDIRLYKQFLQNNNALRIIINGKIGPWGVRRLLAIGKKLGQERLYKVMRIVAEDKSGEVDRIIESIGYIAEDRPERFDSVIEVIEGYEGEEREMVVNDIVNSTESKMDEFSDLNNILDKYESQLKAKKKK
jgi:hypothetical protein